MSFRIVIPQDITGAGKEYLLDNGYELLIGDGKIDAESLKKIVAEADALLVRSAICSKEIIDAAPGLKVIGNHGVGVDNIDIDYCIEKGIWVTNAPMSNTVSVAEHTVGLLFALAHNFVFMDSETRKGNWEIRNRLKGDDLAGKTLGLVGLGRIGRLVAKKASLGADMKVIGFDPFIPSGAFPADVEQAATMEDVFKKADYVSVHVPSLPETHGIINLRLFSMMKKTAAFINCSRGDVVNERDLFTALSEGMIRTAGIDVFCDEPALMKNPLFTLDNIIVTPHSAAMTAESMDRMGLHAAMGIHDVLSGNKPKWAVNEL